MTTIPPTHTAAPARPVAAGSPASAASPAGAVRWVYLVRGIVAIAWAAAFAAVSDSLTAVSATFLVLYPLIDVVASLVDTRALHSSTEQKLLWFGTATSGLAALALAIAASGNISDVLRVFGVWATISGLVQVVAALRRRGPHTGGQWPMLIAGGLSTLVGIFYNIAAGGDNPKLNNLIAYAAAGGTFFLIQAAILARRRRRSPTTHIGIQPDAAAR